MPKGLFPSLIPHMLQYFSYPYAKYNKLPIYSGLNTLKNICYPIPAMPYKIKKGTGAKPWKIIALETGKIVGSSTSKKKAEASARARLAGAHGWKGTRRA